MRKKAPPGSRLPIRGWRVSDSLVDAGDYRGRKAYHSALCMMRNGIAFWFDQTEEIGRRGLSGPLGWLGKDHFMHALAQERFCGPASHAH